MVLQHVGAHRLQRVHLILTPSTSYQQNWKYKQTKLHAHAYLIQIVYKREAYIYIYDKTNGEQHREAADPTQILLKSNS